MNEPREDVEAQRDELRRLLKQALDRLEQTERALREIERMGDYVYKPHEFAAVARAALVLSEDEER